MILRGFLFTFFLTASVNVPGIEFGSLLLLKFIPTLKFLYSNIHLSYRVTILNIITFCLSRHIQLNTEQ